MASGLMTRRKRKSKEECSRKSGFPAGVEPRASRLALVTERSREIVEIPSQGFNSPTGRQPPRIEKLSADQESVNTAAWTDVWTARREKDISR